MLAAFATESGILDFTAPDSRIPNYAQCICLIAIDVVIANATKIVQCCSMEAIASAECGGALNDCNCRIECVNISGVWYVFVASDVLYLDSHMYIQAVHCHCCWRYFHDCKRGLFLSRG